MKYKNDLRPGLRKRSAWPESAGPKFGLQTVSRRKKHVAEAGCTGSKAFVLMLLQVSVHRGRPCRSNASHKLLNNPSGAPTNNTLSIPVLLVMRATATMHILVSPVMLYAYLRDSGGNCTGLGYLSFWVACCTTIAIVLAIAVVVLFVMLVYGHYVDDDLGRGHCVGHVAAVGSRPTKRLMTVMLRSMSIGDRPGRRANTASICIIIPGEARGNRTTSHHGTSRAGSPPRQLPKEEPPIPGSLREDRGPTAE